MHEFFFDKSIIFSIAGLVGLEVESLDQSPRLNFQSHWRPAGRNFGPFDPTILYQLAKRRLPTAQSIV